MTDNTTNWKAEIIDYVDRYILTLDPEDTSAHVEAERFKDYVLNLPD